MSVIIFRHNSEGKWPLILAANHDEVRDRISLGVKVLGHSPLVIGDQDAKHGGTWLAMSQRGLCVGCININPLLPHDTKRVSRGALVQKLAQQADATAAADYLADIKPGTINGAYLLMADARKIFLGQVTDDGINIEVITGNHWHVLGSLGLDAKGDPKTSRARYLIHTSGMSDNSDHIGQLKPILRDHAKPMWPCRDGDKVTDSICYHSAGYSTKSATILRLGQNGEKTFRNSSSPLCKGKMSDYISLLG